MTYRRGTWVLLAGIGLSLSVLNRSSHGMGHDALRNIVRIVQSIPIGKDILKRKGDEL